MTFVGSGPGPAGMDMDLGMVSAEIEALRDLGGDPKGAEDKGKVYDFSIKWGVLMTGRLKRIEHYHRAGDLTEEQGRRYRELKRELKEAIPLIERLGIARPTVPLED